MAESFRAKVKHAVIMPPLYWDLEMMEEIFIVIKWNKEKVKMDAAVIHEVTGLSIEGETLTVIEKSEVDRETWTRELCALDTQVYFGGIRIVDISNKKLQWAAKILVSKFLSKQKHTYIPGGLVPLLLALRDGVKMNWCEFLANNIEQQLGELKTNPFR